MHLRGSTGEVVQALARRQVIALCGARQFGRSCCASRASPRHVDRTRNCALPTQQTLIREGGHHFLAHFASSLLISPSAHLRHPHLSLASHALAGTHAHTEGSRRAGQTNKYSAQLVASARHRAQAMSPVQCKRRHAGVHYWRPALGFLPLMLHIWVAHGRLQVRSGCRSKLRSNTGSPKFWVRTKFRLFGSVPGGVLESGGREPVSLASLAERPPLRTIGWPQEKPDAPSRSRRDVVASGGSIATW